MWQSADGFVCDTRCGPALKPIYVLRGDDVESLIEQIARAIRGDSEAYDAETGSERDLYIDAARDVLFSIGILKPKRKT